ncbi:hypothetical protein HNQ77_000443 [Silvibacterium bohemicum]|uniref:DUF4424 domain-containing protein n=1 Tax=Silvibacterium bohemicum TaxID=1577686 RepID=A0A841JQ04_9BACT|nr:hypothetical protein [Silvibacterium bohemicum]MBB6142505.1 hypothetical protein [Silvibacterium bohemicum]
MRVKATRLFALLMVFAGPYGLLAQNNGPYTAEFKVTSIQTLANGGTITRETTEKRARDSQGLTFLSHQLPSPAVHNTTTMVNIHDPVAGTSSMWDSVHKQATVTVEPPRDLRGGCWESDSGRMRFFNGPATHANASASSPAAIQAAVSPAQPRLKPVHEDLGTATIQGVEAHGVRTTWTTPVGEVGNDVPLVRTSEVWSSKDPNLVLREITDDPRSGKGTRELTSLDLNEPDASLFAPPADYEVKTIGVHQIPCEQAR